MLLVFCVSQLFKRWIKMTNRKLDIALGIINVRCSKPRNFECSRDKQKGECNGVWCCIYCDYFLQCIKNGHECSTAFTYVKECGSDEQLEAIKIYNNKRRRRRRAMSTATTAAWKPMGCCWTSGIMLPWFMTRAWTRRGTRCMSMVH